MNHYDNQITSKVYQLLEKRQFTNFVLENNTMHHRNIILRLSTNLNTIKANQLELENKASSKMVIPNTIVEANAILDNSLLRKRKEMTHYSRRRNKCVKKINELKAEIELIKDDIELIENEGLENIVIAKFNNELADKDKEGNHLNEDDNIEVELLKNKKKLFEPFESQNSRKGSIISINLIDTNDFNFDKEDGQDDDNPIIRRVYLSKLNSVKGIPKLNLNEINRKNTNKVKKPSKNKHKHMTDKNKLKYTIQVLNKKNKAIENIIEEFKIWFENIPPDILSRIIKIKEMNNKESL